MNRLSGIHKSRDFSGQPVGEKCRSNSLMKGGHCFQIVVIWKKTIFFIKGFLQQPTTGQKYCFQLITVWNKDDSPPTSFKTSVQALLQNDQKM